MPLTDNLGGDWNYDPKRFASKRSDDWVGT